MTVAVDKPRVLIAGVGNIFLGDDGFGVEAARKLADGAVPSGIRVADFGIRGIDLAFALLDGYDTVILLDAMPRGGQPGTLYVLEPDLHDAAAPSAGMIEMHNLDPVKVFGFATSLGATLPRLLVIGCEPTPLCDEIDAEVGLSDAVQASLDEAVSLALAHALEALDAADRNRSSSPSLAPSLAREK
jgi:hydrogenase maturation protease